MDKNQERELIEKARKDPESFGVLFDTYYPKIFGYVVKRTAHIQAAQDITSEVFFKAYKKLWQFRWRGISFGSWLYKIATNEVNRYFENGKRAPMPSAFIEELEHLTQFVNSPELELIGQQQEFAGQQDRVRLYNALQRLPIKYQEVLTLRYFEEKSLLEICQILGKKEGTIKSLISRGIDMLEKHMQPSSQNAVIYTKSINSHGHEQAGH